jgi:ATP-dependent DNA helicase Rep
VLDFATGWPALRRPDRGPRPAAGEIASEARSLLEVAQTISLIASLAEREQEQDVVTLSTLHAAKGWNGRTWCWPA